MSILYNKSLGTVTDLPFLKALGYNSSKHFVDWKKENGWHKFEIASSISCCKTTCHVKSWQLEVHESTSVCIKICHWLWFSSWNCARNCRSARSDHAMTWLHCNVLALRLVVHVIYYSAVTCWLPDTILSLYYHCCINIIITTIK